MIVFRVLFTLFFVLIPGLVLADGYAHPWQIDFQPSASLVNHKLYDLHNFLLIIITVITFFVLGLLVYVCIRFNHKNNPVPAKFTHNLKLEIIWTTIPILILVAIAIPSMRTLYYMDVVPKEDMTFKVIGHQWYWEYAYKDERTGESFNFDSYMIKDADLKPGQLRLLEVDNRVLLPVNKTIKILITSADVIHAWAVPALGVKTDAIPGRTNETWVYIDKPGVYYGQCSQLCGFGHGFMPIAIQAVSEEEYKAWFAQAKQKFANSNQLKFSYNNIQ